MTTPKVSNGRRPERAAQTDQSGESQDTILDEAKRLVYGDRHVSYGRVVDEYEAVAAAFGALTGVEITAEQALVFMLVVKLSRLSHNPAHRDSVVDIAGYAACLAQVQDARSVAVTDAEAP